MTYIGIDNGTSGSIAILDGLHDAVFLPTPTISEQSYTKAKKTITRVDSMKLMVLLELFPGAMVILERPMINPGRFAASMSAMRALEATLIVIESLGLARMYVDSKQWQRELLPKGVTGPELKKASVDIGCRLFPSLAEVIRKHGDADGLLIAEYWRRKDL